MPSIRTYELLDYKTPKPRTGFFGRKKTSSTDEEDTDDDSDDEDDESPLTESTITESPQLEDSTTESTRSSTEKSSNTGTTSSTGSTSNTTSSEGNVARKESVKGRRVPSSATTSDDTQEEKYKPVLVRIADEERAKAIGMQVRPILEDAINTLRQSSGIYYISTTMIN